MPRATTKRARPPAPIPQFYASVVDEAELVEAQRIDGIDHEIALLRVQLRTALLADPADYKLMLKGIELIARTAAARYRMSPKSKQELADSIAATLDTFGEQLFPERFKDV